MRQRFWPPLRRIDHARGPVLRCNGVGRVLRPWPLQRTRARPTAFSTMLCNEGEKTSHGGGLYVNWSLRNDFSPPYHRTRRTLDLLGRVRPALNVPCNCPERSFRRCLQSGVNNWSYPFAGVHLCAIVHKWFCFRTIVRKQLAGVLGLCAIVHNPAKLR